MGVRFLFSTCLFAALFVQMFAVDLFKLKLGGSRKYSKRSRLMDGTPVDKADGWSKVGSDEQHEKGQSGQNGDTLQQPTVAGPNEAGAGAAYGPYKPPLYGTPNSFSNGASGQFAAPNSYPNSGAYGMNPCNCPPQVNNQLPYGGGSYSQNSLQGPQLQRNQDVIGRQGYQPNQGFPPYAQYPPYNVLQYPPLLPYPVMPPYAYQQFNNQYPYNYYYPQRRGQLFYGRNSRHDKQQRRAKKQRSDGVKYGRDKIRQKDRKMAAENETKHH